MSELNPNHPTTSTMREHWHKIALMLMHKFGERHVVITSRDVEAMCGMFPGDLPAIVVSDLHDGLHLDIVSITEGEKLAREHGGLPS